MVHIPSSKRRVPRLVYAGLAAASTCAALTASCVDTSEELTATVTDFRGDARGAYSIIHDDVCDYGTDGIRDHAIVGLSERGLRAGLGAISAQCEARSYWPILEDAISHGHEILSHSATHPSLVMDPDYETQIDGSKASIEENVAGARVTFFIFPFDEFDDAALEYLESHDFLGARAGERGLNDPIVPDPMRLNFDVYGPEYSIYKDAYEKGTVEDILKKYVDDAVSQHKWAVRELHGVEDNSWEAVPLADYTTHLDYVKGLVDSGALWMDTPTEITRYTQSRALCGTPVVEGNVLRFKDPQPGCDKYRTKLTVRISSLNGLHGLEARQGDVKLTTRAIDFRNALIDGVDPSQDTLLDVDGEYGPGSSLGGAPNDGSGGTSTGGAASGGSASGGSGGAPSSGGTSSGGSASGGAGTGGAASGGAAQGGHAGMGGIAGSSGL